MKKKQWLKIGLVLAFVLSVGWRYFYGRNLGQDSPGEARKLLTVQSDGEKIKTEVTTGGFAVVKRVVDGDTVELENGEKARYIGIDTPETLDPRKPVQCFGKNATVKNKELVEGKPVWLVKDITDKDKYGRLLRYVYLGDPDQESSVFVNMELVKQGFAHSSTYPPDIKYQELFLAAQTEARENQRGLWADCPAKQDPASQDPALLPSFPSTSSNPSSDCLIKGNIGSTGEKIYYLPGCGSYDKTKVDESRGEKWFCGEDEAISAGWRKAKNC